MMRVARRQVLGGLVLTGLATSLGRLWQAVAGPIGATVIAVVNTATAKRPEGPEEPVEQGTVIDAGTEIATEAKSALQVQLADGSQLTAGARSRAVVGPSGPEQVTLSEGNFRFRTAGPSGEGRALATPALLITLKGTELIVQVKPNLTVCGVVSGVITCTSLKTGKSVDVSAGQSVAWAAGSFGTGVTEGIFTTGDPAADDGIEAARETWNPPPPPPEPKPDPVPAPK